MDSSKVARTTGTQHQQNKTYHLKIIIFIFNANLRNISIQHGSANRLYDFFHTIFFTTISSCNWWKTWLVRFNKLAETESIPSQMSWILIYIQWSNSFSVSTLELYFINWGTTYYVMSIYLFIYVGNLYYLRNIFRGEGVFDVRSRQGGEGDWGRRLGAVSTYRKW